MEVQRILIRRGDVEYSTWQVLRADHLPLVPVNKFLSYLENTGKSPNTVKSYAHHLRRFFIFLEYKTIDWREIDFGVLAEFTGYLKIPAEDAVKLFSAAAAPNVISFPRKTPSAMSAKSSRSNNTINVMLAAVCSFYEYHSRICELPKLNIYQLRQPMGNVRYKPFLHGMTLDKQTVVNKLKLRPERKRPKTISREEFGELVAACDHLRDKFILSLLYETGMRVGQMLGLRHEDVRTFDKIIAITPRERNVNAARAKTNEPYSIHVSEELMRLYTDYLLDECGEIESDYVFLNLWGEPVGRPMSYPAVVDLFRRLTRKTGIYISPHMLRHTHATEMIRLTGRPDVVSRRLGHKSIQTTLKTYAHLDETDLMRVYKEYETNRKQK